MRTLTADEERQLERRREVFTEFVEDTSPCVVELAEVIVQTAPGLAQAHDFADPALAASDPARFLPVLDAWLRDVDVSPPPDADRTWLAARLMYTIALYLQRERGGQWHLVDDPDSPLFAHYVIRMPPDRSISPGHVANAVLEQPPGRSVIRELQRLDQAEDGMSGADFEVSDELLGLIFEALDHGIRTVSDFGADADAMHPFALFERAGGRDLRRLIGMDAQRDIARGRDMARESGAERVALAYDGFVTVDGTKSDAILVEAAERGMDRAVLFAQRYAPATTQDPFKTVGNALFLGQVDGLLPKENT